MYKLINKLPDIQFPTCDCKISNVPKKLIIFVSEHDKLMEQPFTYTMQIRWFYVRLLQICCAALLINIPLAKGQDTAFAPIDRAEILLKEGQIDQGKLLFQSILQEYKPHARPDSLQIRAQLGMARAWHLHQQLDSSLQAYLKALDLAKSTPSSPFLSDIHMGIGVLHSQSKNFQEAITHLKRADSLAEENTIKKLQIRVNLGNVFLESDNSHEALGYLNTSLELAKNLDQLPTQAIIHTNLSNLFIKEQHWPAAIEHAQKSLEIRDELNQVPSVVTYNNLGYALVQTGKLDEGEKAYLHVLSLSQGVQRQLLLKNLKDLYTLQGNYPLALQYFTQYDHLKDSIQQQNLDQRIAEITEAYESAEKSQKIHTLEIENKIRQQQLGMVIIGSIMFILLIVLATYLYLKNERVKRELAHSKTKNQLLLAQLNPHFIFNSLQHIQHYLYHNDRETSMVYLSNFARLMRLILEHSDTEWIPLEEEIELLDKYLHLQRLASPVSFEYQIEMDPTLDASNIKLPPMLLQPFVENAVKHGIHDRKNARIGISAQLGGSKLTLTITDNGKGIHAATVCHSNHVHKSLGSQLIHKRLDEINKQYLKFVELTIEEITPNEEYPGTRIRFTFDLDRVSKI